MSSIIAKAYELEAQGKLNSKTSSQIRGGATHLPLVNSAYLNINQILPPLHAKINLLCNVLELLYLFNARQYFVNRWPLCNGLASKRSDVQKKQCGDAERKFQADAMNGPLNLKLGQHIIGSGGTSNTGGSADDFFSEERRPELMKIIKFENDEEELKNKMELFLQHCNVVIRTMCTKAHIDNLDEFEEYCLEANALMCEIFEWKLCAGSSHLLFGHVAHKIRLNGGHGLGQIYEGGYQNLLKLKN